MMLVAPVLLSCLAGLTAATPSLTRTGYGKFPDMPELPAGISPPPRGQAPYAIALAVTYYHYPSGCTGGDQWYEPATLYDIKSVSQTDQAFFNKLSTKEVLTMNQKRLPVLGLVETPLGDHADGEDWFSRRTPTRIEYFFHGYTQVEKPAPSSVQARGLSGETPRHWARYQNADGRVVYRVSTVGGSGYEHCTGQPTKRKGAAQFWFF